MLGRALNVYVALQWEVEMVPHNTKQTLVMIAEEDPLIRRNLASILSGEPEFRVCGSFALAAEALSAIVHLAPDIFITAIELPDIIGTELIRRAKAKIPLVDIMVYTNRDDPETVFKALRAGASGYMLKGTSLSRIIEAIHMMAEGGAPMSPKIARMVVNNFHEPELQDLNLLTQREAEILRLLDRGYSYKMISDRCNISPYTVNTHIKKIYYKLNAKSRSDAILGGRRFGII